MINKLAKAHKGWISKLILTLTALSFMSLFGVSGYLSNASNNRAVIRVDNIEILQSQFSYLAQNELAMASALLGDGQELTDEMRVAVIYGLSQKLLNDSILDRTADKYNVVFNPLFIQSLIVNDATFKDSAGNFSKEMFRELLAKSGLSEAEYVKAVKRNLVNRFLIQGQVLNVNVPQVLLDAESKVDNKRRTFKYVNIKPSEMVVDRSITDEEINQYYEDFSSNYM
ncbi:MAG: SurA N-terminal domain-containing protein [Alphaproteobacteria bacterium]|nr:SurA N-terminal domain-containing protein [Alphaproteobacteria bacterium]